MAEILYWLLPSNKGMVLHTEITLGYSENLMTLDDVPVLALRALPEILQSGSISAAARNLGVSQPAVSKSIAQLEDHLGVEMLRRGKMPLLLTDEGMALARYVERDVLLRKQVLDDVAAARRLRKGIVRIGSFGASASTHLLPRLIADLRRLHSGIEVEIHEVPDLDVLAALRAGTVDVGVVVDPADDLETVAAGTDKLVALVSDAHPLAGKTCVDPVELAAQPFIMTKGGSEPMVRAWFAHGEQVPEIRHTVQQITSILALVRIGLGVSIIAERALPETHANVCVIPLSPNAPRSVYFARMRGGVRSAAVGALWNIVEQSDF